MDGTGRWRDNVFVERLWRSLKYEEVYLHAYQTVRDSHQRVARYITFYNQARPHQALMGQVRGCCTMTTCPHGMPPRRLTPSGAIYERG